MSTSIRSRWLATSLTLLALVFGASATTVSTTAAPAQAATSYEVCFPVATSGGLIQWHCIDIPLAIEKCGFCPQVAIGIDHIVLPEEVQRRFVDELLNGIDLLDQAANADPRTAAYLTGQAQEAFLAATEALGGAEIRLDAVGTPGREGVVAGPDPQPWLEAAGADLVTGVAYLQRALAEPEPDPWLEAGMDAFQQAYQQLAQQQVIEG